jgi:serine/threonine-protein kinase SRPK3
MYLIDYVVFHAVNIIRIDKFKFAGLVPKNLKMENMLLHIGGEEKKMFLDFIRRMLHWRPADRSSAEELLSDP